MFGSNALENYSQTVNESLALQLDSSLSATLTSVITTATNLYKNSTISLDQKKTDLNVLKSRYENLCERKKFVEQKVIPWLDKNKSESTTELKQALTLTLSRFKTLEQWIGLVATQCGNNSVKVSEPAPKRSWFSCLS